MQSVIQFVGPGKSKGGAAGMTAARKYEVNCASCNLREMCMPQGLSAEEMQRMENLVYARRKLKRGEALFRAADKFSAVYAIRAGFFKTAVMHDDGREQVTGFQMAGELMGLDGIGSRVYEVDAVALEDSQVCVMPFDDLRRWHWRSTHCCSSSIA